MEVDISPPAISVATAGEQDIPLPIADQAAAMEAGKTTWDVFPSESVTKATGPWLERFKR